MSAIICEEYTAPACWASYLVNGDGSGLEAAEIAQADTWAASLPGPIVSCGDESSFSWTYDAQAVLGRIGADVLAYLIHRPGTKAEAEEQAASRAAVAAATSRALAEETAEAAQDALEAAQETRAEAQAARNALGRSDPSGLVLGAQARLAAAIARESDALEAATLAAEALALAEDAEALADARHARALADLARLADLERAAEALDIAPGLEARTLAEIAPSRGWSILAEYQGRRFFLGAHHFAQDAETWARAWAGAYGDGVRFFVADLHGAGSMVCNGDSVAFVAAFESRLGARPDPIRRAIWAEAMAGGRRVTLGRAYTSCDSLNARAWAEAEAACWPGPVRVFSLDVQAEAVAEIAQADLEARQ